MHKMAAQNKSPEVRFAGFTDHWEVQILGERADVGDGLHGTPTYEENGGVYFINGNNLIAGKIVVNNETKEVLEKERSNADKELNDSTLLLSINGTIGNLAFYRDEKVMLGKSVAYIKLKSFCKEFIYHYLKSPIIQYHFLSNLTGSTIKNLGLKIIRETEIFTPHSNEQIQIANYFENLDGIINNHQTQLSKLKNLKKAMLIKMFPQNGASVPEIRFKGFDGEWKEHELGDLAEIIGGGTPSTTNPDYWNGDIDWYSPTEIDEKHYKIGSVKKITPIGLASCSATILPANRTILFTSRAGIGKLAIIRNEGSTNQGFQSLVLNENIDTYFMYSVGYLIKKYALSKASGSTFLEISGKTLNKMKIFIPREKEQKMIGSYFKSLDDLIENHQEQLKKLDNIKKACLSKLFIT
jgi:type I restriction enzyme S subunit